MERWRSSLIVSPWKKQWFSVIGRSQVGHACRRLKQVGVVLVDAPAILRDNRRSIGTIQAFNERINPMTRGGSQETMIFSCDAHIIPTTRRYDDWWVDDRWTIPNLPLRVSCSCGKMGEVRATKSNGWIKKRHAAVVMVQSVWIDVHNTMYMGAYR